jgi:hypothetical protein
MTVLDACALVAFLVGGSGATDAEVSRGREASGS